VRAGRNTLAPYDENPPDLTVAEDDIVFLDLGPVFEELEADFGRTYVVGRSLEIEALPGHQGSICQRQTVSLYVHPKNHSRMRMPDASGRKRHWILEIHFVDRVPEIGGFYEELLTIG